MLIYAKENDLDALTREGFCVVDFYSETCGPCMMLAPVLEKLESELPFVRFVKVNTTACPNYAEQYDIQAVPTLLFMNEGKVKARTQGSMPEDQLRETIGRHLYC